jgi:hypothetical protein
MRARPSCHKFFEHELKHLTEPVESYESFVGFILSALSWILEDLKFALTPIAPTSFFPETKRLPDDRRSEETFISAEDCK